MKNLITVLFICISFQSFSQDNYEIQVYGSPTQDKGTTQLELHSNFTFNGERNIIKGIRPTNHALHETLEITHGFTDNFEIGFYFFTNYTSPFGYQYVGSHIRPRISAPEKWKLPVGLSLSMEVGYQKQEYSADTWNWEIRPIIDKQWGKLYASFNPAFGVSLKGIENNSTPVFEPNFKMDYQFLKHGSLGIEYYGSMGYINGFDRLADQNHALFFTYDLEDDPKWEFNIGAGFGLTQATDGFVLKTILGRRINWKKKKK
jgi:hypothetical protein